MPLRQCSSEAATTPTGSFPLTGRPWSTQGSRIRLDRWWQFNQKVSTVIENLRKPKSLFIFKLYFFIGAHFTLLRLLYLIDRPFSAWGLLFKLHWTAYFYCWLSLYVMDSCNAAPLLNLRFFDNGSSAFQHFLANFRHESSLSGPRSQSACALAKDTNGDLLVAVAGH